MTKDPVSSSQPPVYPPRAPTVLWLLRHAEVEVAYQSVFGGRIDMNLSPRGDEQASALASYLGGRSFHALYSSPMQRVQQTLKPLLRNKGIPAPVFLEGLREVDFGIWTGLSWDNVRAKHGVSAYHWLEQLDCDGIQGAECGTVFRARVEPCIRQVIAKHPGEHVAVACHGGVIRMILSILLDLPLPKMAAFEVDYASVTQVSLLDGRNQIELMNFTPWRDLPLK